MSSICALWQCQGMPVASGEPRLATDRGSGADVIRWSWGRYPPARGNHPRDRRRRPVTYVTGWASLNEPVGIDTGLPRPWGASANSSWHPQGRRHMLKNHASAYGSCRPSALVGSDDVS